MIWAIRKLIINYLINCYLKEYKVVYFIESNCIFGVLPAKNLNYSKLYSKCYCKMRLKMKDSRMTFLVQTALLY